MRNEAASSRPSYLWCGTGKVNVLRPLRVEVVNRRECDFFCSPFQKITKKRRVWEALTTVFCCGPGVNVVRGVMHINCGLEKKQPEIETKIFFSWKRKGKGDQTIYVWVLFKCASLDFSHLFGATQTIIEINLLSGIQCGRLMRTTHIRRKEKLISKLFFSLKVIVSTKPPILLSSRK